MNGVFDRFYAIDFDRCLGDTDASFELLEESLEHLGIISGIDLKRARSWTEQRGESFSAFSYLRHRETSAGIESIVDYFQEAGLRKSGSLLEPGAHELLMHLSARGQHYGIMSFGDPQTQASKIIAAGLGHIPRLIVDHPYKAKDIAQWQDPQTGFFVIPKELSASGESFLVREVVLIDDKATAFDGLPQGALGYWIVKGQQPLRFQDGVVPAKVVRLQSMDAIIGAESERLLTKHKLYDSM